MHSSGKKTILLIEDERSTARLEKVTLEKNGFIVLTAGSGEDAVKIASQRDDIDLILTDITLAGQIDGVETAEAIHRRRYIPVVFLTVHTGADVVERTEKVSSYGYVVKNTGESVLIAAIRMAFRLYEANVSINDQKLEIEAANEEMQAAIEEMEAINQELIETQRSLLESEIKFKAVMEQSPLPMMIFALDGTLMDANGAWEKMWGADKNVEIGRYNVFADSRLDVIKPYIDKALSGEPADLPVESYIHRPGFKRGERLWLAGKVYPLKIDEIKVNNIVIVSEDVTERIKAEEAIRVSEEKFRNIFMNMTIGYFRTGLDGRLLDLNPACLRILGYDSEDEVRSMLNNSSYGVYVSKSDWSMVRESLLSGNSPYIGTVQFRKKDGSEFSAGLNVRIVNSADDIPDHIEGLIEDVTERIKMQEMLLQSEKMMTVAGLAAGMAHEINNPLGIIMQNAENAVHRLLDTLPGNIDAAVSADIEFDKIRQYVRARRIDIYLISIREAGERAARIVDNMLQFSRGTESKFSYTNVNFLIDKALDLASNEYDIRKNYDFRNITIEKNYGTLPDMQCAETPIEQVFLNIFKNSAQAMNSSVNDPDNPNKIRISTWFADGDINIEISDNGPGMDEATRRRIFEPFFSTKEPGVGTGLGLSVSYYIIVDRHEGTISVKSQPGAGTVFTITLPVKRRL